LRLRARRLAAAAEISVALVAITGASAALAAGQ
jgi:hypothetical protein